jgi:hypothetical protein
MNFEHRNSSAGSTPGLHIVTAADKTPPVSIARVHNFSTGYIMRTLQRKRRVAAKSLLSSIIFWSSKVILDLESEVN